MNINLGELQEHWDNMLPLTFKVKINGKKSKLVANPKLQTVTVVSGKKDSSTEVIPGNQIFFLKQEDDKKSLIRWVREKTEVEEKLSFDSVMDRQRFSEAVNVISTMDRNSLRDLSEQATILTVTWNMGDTAPPESLERLLCRKIDNRRFRPNIVAVAVQECSHSPPKSEGKSTSTHVSNVIQRTLGDDYVQLLKTSLWTIRLFVFVKRDDIGKISALEKCKEACGIAHVVGNKGAVAITFKFNETSFCFVGSHLAAHQEKVEDRNHDFVEILKGLEMGENHFSIDTQFNHVFWMGDLNYRIDLPRERVIELIEAEDFESLRGADQLIEQRNNENVFMFWREGQINFRPTYRFLRGTNQYDEELGRIPSWCDRVMFKSLPTDEAHIQLLEYGAEDSIQTSDHHPVYAAFEVNTLRQNVLHPKRDLVIHITNLHGDNLVAKDRNGKSDPFVKFRGVFLEKQEKTRVIKATLNPVWKNEHVPELVPLITNNYLQRLYVHFVVQDWDLTSAADNMGQGVIPLGNVFGADKPVPFTSRVTLRGSPAGTISGHIQIIDKSAK